ncbi:uncharacterized protein LOC141713168 isoform X2 [Apium graveolens]|uniref:uncharacterized protein LOC141713168 isoform X2 n=1 Tax=Apium graveolens TaxID=4045 RepID=UPI003D79B95A
MKLYLTEQNDQGGDLGGILDPEERKRFINFFLMTRIPRQHPVVNWESLPNWEEKQMFKQYYDLDAYHRRKLEKQMKKGFKKAASEEGKIKYRNSYDCLVKTVKIEGFKALSKGFIPTWARLGPLQFVFWVSYEKFRQIAAALGMLSTISTGLAIDAYGPISDNAGGIDEMAGMSHWIRERTDALDAAGNTVAAIGKGIKKTYQRKLHVYKKGKAQMVESRRK